ncbi:hypothetical protein CgunFtcFv8_012352 [Champsocephalus gunnari]|uniref:Uncharacterized protein n=1 Tax=Champsocephalus gunnari TaxID=52237 RepID=A0AAN8HIC0_CHAGU|nr:hypothetical protein CgunFtcFv8_012352 [Champsocephalus gunnari]
MCSFVGSSPFSPTTSPVMKTRLTTAAMMSFFLAERLATLSSGRVSESLQNREGNPASSSAPDSGSEHLGSGELDLRRGGGTL